jgi:5-methyltetrahydropteroyltriglutamate--homocysteine methyltransferase
VFEAILIGNQPKIFDGAHPVNLRAVRNQFDKERATAAEVEAAVRDTIRFTVSDQTDAGIDRITDGRIRWDDPATPLAAAHDGFAIGGLIRYFDNNVYYRRPVITGPIKFVRSAAAEDFRFLKSCTDRPLMASVCGPFSLAQFCQNEHYQDHGSLLADCAQLVRRELSALADAGAEWVQLDEPFLGFAPERIKEAVAAIRDAVDGVRVKTLVYSYFCSLRTVIDPLWALPVTAIGADCATHPENFALLCGGPSNKGRCFGLLDARTTRLEPAGRIGLQLERLIDQGAGQWPVCFVSPSAALEFLPYENAVRKLKRLTEAVRHVRQPAAQAD